MPTHIWTDVLALFGAPSRHDTHLREFVRLAVGVLGADAMRRPPLRSPPEQDGKSLLERCGLRTAAARERRVEYAKQITRDIADKFGVSLPKMALRFATLEGHAGHVQLRNGVWHVDIDEAYRWDDPGLTAILAHEFAHVVLERRGVHLESELSNECLTDTVAALAGFVRILHEVRERRETQYLVLFTRTVTRRLGYLSRRDLAALDAMQRRIAKGIPKRRLLELTVRLDTPLECLCCGSPMRLPPVDGRLRVRCPHCGLVEDLWIRHGYVHPLPATSAARLRVRILAAIDRFNGFSLPE